ncbi:MAG TPA: HAMP domain-containing sensor histidine kinase [Bacteroidales bacterium]
MKIRTKLTIQFILVTAIILLTSSVAIYLFSNNYRIDEFYDRLLGKANNTAKLLLDVDEIDAALLYKIEKDNPMSLPNEKIIIFDYKNDILFSTDEENTIKYDSKLLDRIRLKHEYRFSQDEYNVLGYLFTSKYDHFTIIIAATDIYGLNKIENLQKVLLFVNLLSLVLLLYAGWIYSGRALKPISRIINEVNEISASNLHMRLYQGRSKDELEQLAQTFNKMISSLEIAFKSQKYFISNASHELRTPLMSIIGQIEYILLNQRTPEEYETILHSIHEDIKSFSLLLNRLLLLAQTNTDIPKTDDYIVRIDEILWQAYEDIVKRHPDYKVDISMNELLNDDNMTVYGDEQLLKTAFLNLMENACKYSTPPSVSVSMNFSKLGFIIIEFTDEGIGIPEQDIQHIKTPFFRGSNSIQVKGQGIGLSLVDRIVNIHHGAVEIISTLGKGTCVVVKLPQLKKPS